MKRNGLPIEYGQCPGFGIYRASGGLLACRSCGVFPDDEAAGAWLRNNLWTTLQEWKVLPPLPDGACTLCGAPLGEPALPDAEMALRAGAPICAGCAEVLAQEDPKDWPERFRAACNRRDPRGPCDVGCAGWDLFNDEIQRCDPCGVFVSDEEATVEAIRHLSDVCGFNIECGKSDGHLFFAEEPGG
jgi:hypothetical protein